MSPATLCLLVLLGVAVGTYGTMIGAGGGFLLVPLLFLLFGHARPEIVTGVSLCVVFVNAASGSLAYARMGRVDYRSGLMFGAAAIPGALLGASMTKLVPTHLFELVLGPTLALTGVYLAIRPSGKECEPFDDAPFRCRRRIVDRDGTVHEYSYAAWIGIASSSVVGFLSSILGIGGGIIHVPVLSKLLRFPVHIATATSHFVLAIMTLTGALVHIWSGDLNGRWGVTAALAVGALAGAQLGAILSSRVRAPLIIRALAGGLVLVGLRVVLVAV